MSILKTRDVLVGVARQLFARLGFDATTMNDIASESNKGRRTLYTYFNSKQEVYDAVIESEIKFIISELQKISMERTDPEVKLRSLFSCRMRTIKEIVKRNGHLRADFFRDVIKVEKARRSYSTEELAIIRSILSDGKTLGVFQIENVEATALLFQYAMQGMDIPNIKGYYNEKGVTPVAIAESLFNMVFHGIMRGREYKYTIQQ